ncbi:MAG: hypothetical protein WC635_06755 [Bacteriovorax sp.]|jgi:hypothetical protein
MREMISKIKSSHNNQNGFSIVMVITALALVSAGTVYIMEINKQSAKVSAAARSTSFTELERRRISGVLANSDTCKLAANFGGQGPVRGAINSLVSADGTPLVVLNGQYYNKVLTLVKISTVQTTAGSAKGYDLFLDYYDASANKGTRTSYTGKTSTTIRIPMYMKKNVGGNVVDCYALTETNQLDTAITNACSPGIINTANSRYVLEQTTEGNVADCSSEITFDNGQGGNNPNSVCGGSKFFRGLVAGPIAATGQALQFTNSLCFNLTGTAAATTGCAAYQGAHQISGGNVTCQYPGITRDTDAGSALCGAGQILFRTGPSTTTCVTVSCATDSYVNAIGSGGTTCYSVPVQSCTAAGQYVSGFTAAGNPTCADLPALNGSCAGGFATSVDRTTTGGTLVCAAYTVAKSCAPGPTTFAYQISPTAITCRTW